MKKKISLYAMALFYLLAGTNHFRNPGNYMAIIPPYLGHASLINTMAGIAELMLGLLLLFSATRKFAFYGIAAMLLAFVPAHIYMLQEHNCIGKFCVPGWLLWGRLILLQPLLIWWAWSVRNVK